MPVWVDGISPFWHLLRPPVETLDPLPAVAERVLAVALVLLGVWGYRRRDVAAG